MANRNTKRGRAANGYKAKRGQGVDSSAERAKSGRQQYKAPTMKAHPISGEPSRAHHG